MRVQGGVVSYSPRCLCVCGHLNALPAGWPCRLRRELWAHLLYNEKHRGALRGTPGSACPQPEHNATELPSCAPISASRELRKEGGGSGGGEARRTRAA